MRRFVLVLLSFAVIESFATDKNKYVLKTSAKVEVYDSRGNYKKTITLKAGTQIVPPGAESSAEAKRVHVASAASNQAGVATLLEGAQLIADDGKFLGKITWNDFASDSIFNSVGRYGSDVSAESIWNEVSQYGSDVSSYSPFNSVASTPPRIIKGDKVVGYLTLNDGKAKAISPVVLLQFLNDSSDKMYRKRLLPFLK